MLGHPKEGWAGLGRPPEDQIRKQESGEKTDGLQKGTVKAEKKKTGGSEELGGASGIDLMVAEPSQAPHRKLGRTPGLGEWGARVPCAWGAGGCVSSGAEGGPQKQGQRFQQSQTPPCQWPQKMSSIAFHLLPAFSNAKILTTPGQVF